MIAEARGFESAAPGKETEMPGMEGARGALVAPPVVAGQARHQQLRIAGLDAAEEIGGLRAAKRGSPDAVVQDHHLVAADDVLESMWCGHGTSMPVGRCTRHPGRPRSPEGQIQPGSQLWMSQNG